MKWVKGTPNESGVYLVNYQRAQSAEVKRGVATVNQHNDYVYNTIFGRRGQLTITLDRRSGMWRQPKIVRYAKVA